MAPLCPTCAYSKETKSVTAFDLFTFFHADLIQSEASWKLSSTSDWLMSAWKNVSKLKAITILGSLLYLSHMMITNQVTRNPESFTRGLHLDSLP